MRKTMLGFVIAMSVFGCKKSGGAGDMVAKMEGFSKEMCACADKACGDKVTEAMTKWSQEQAKSAGKDTDKPDPDVTKKMTDVTQKLTECYTKLATAAPADKPADKPAEPQTVTKPDDTAKPADPAAAKPDDKKADDKKPDDKKADDKKPADKKADDKKPDDKKKGGW